MRTRDRQECQKRFRKALSSWSEALKKDKKLTSTDKLVAMHIAEVHLNSMNFRAWPANSTVAAAIGKDARTVQRAVNKQAKLGYFKIERRFGRSNCYVFTTIAEAMAPRAEATTGDGQDCPEGQTRTAKKGRQTCPTILKREYKKELGCAKRALLVSKQRFGLSSSKARAWNKALAERELGCLDDYDITEAIQGEPDYVMPFMWPPSGDAEWEITESYLEQRRRTT